MRKTFIFLVLAVLMLSSFGLVLAENGTNGKNSSNMTAGCANSPDPSTFCEEDQQMVVESYDDEGCAIWGCEEEEDEYCESNNDCSEGYFCEDGECEEIEQDEVEIEIEEEYESEFECCKLEDGGYAWLLEDDCAEPVRGVECRGLLKPHQRNNNRWEYRIGEKSFVCEEGCNLSNGTNMTQLRAMFSNGRHAFIKIMPDVAAERALERLRLKNCIEEEGCTIELKDVGSRDDSEGNETEAEYELSTERPSKVFGFIKSKMRVKAYVDAETGEVTKVKKPWWAFLASEPAEMIEEPEETTEDQ